MIRSAVLAFALTAVAAAPALAQAPRPIEFGMDAVLAVTLDDPRQTTFALPVGVVRAGFFASDQLSFEPAVSFDYANVDGYGSGSELSADLGLLFHFSPNRLRPQGYVRPFAGLRHVSLSADEPFDQGESATQFIAGLGLGMKLPVRDRLALRLEGTFGHTFESDEFYAQDALGVLFGLSFYTR